MLGNVYYKNANTSTLFDDTNRAKRRVRRYEMKAYDPAKANAKKQPFYSNSSKTKVQDALAVDRELTAKLDYVHRLLNNKHPPVAGGRRTKRKTHRKHKRTHKRRRSNK
jgi:hypothetical protein